MDLSFLKVESLQDLASDKEPKPTAGIPLAVEETVRNILSSIRKKGQEAIIDYVGKLDGYQPSKWSDLKVNPSEIEEGYKYTQQYYPDLVKAMSTAVDNITYYHRQQLKREPSTWFITPEEGKKLGQLVKPLRRIGIYVPGGRYPYPSSVLMAAIPAKIAGVQEMVVASPPSPGGAANPALLYLCRKLGIDEIYKIGGAQAIGLFAYGCEETARVDKVVGPGNIYVTCAKKEVFGEVGIDSLAGPSEVIIIADESADHRFVAADLLSQAEHDPRAVSILLTTSRKLANSVIDSLGVQMGLLSEYKQNLETAHSSLKNNCKVIFHPDMDQLIQASNQIGPEHLEIMCKKPEDILKQISNAGAIFLGNYTPVAVGDYMGGTNHIIPTSANVRFASPLGVYDFLKKSSVLYYDQHMLGKEGKYIQDFSAFEGLYAHNHSVKIRFEKD
ncbi:MAG: histidinol dehydrogenase [Actinomycetia bacterium]|nr:histidinol dehydrogenase [Actinomycetes bacterium]